VKATIDAVVHVLALIAGREREAAVDDLCAHSILSRPMASWALTSAIAAFDATTMQVIAEKRAYANESVAVLLAASVATAPLRAVLLPILSAASRVCVRVTARDEPFAQRIVRACGRVTPSLPPVVLSTAPGRAFVRQVATSDAARLVAFGRDETYRQLAAEVAPHVMLEFRGHGHGVAVVDEADAWTDRHALALARDVAAYEQSGCLSPQCVFVRATEIAHWVAGFAAALDSVSVELPVGPVDRATAALVHAWRGALAAADADLRIGRAGSIAVTRGLPAIASPGARNVPVVPYANEFELRDLLAPIASATTTVGVSGPHAARTLSQSLQYARVVPVGAMQTPPLDGWEDPRPPRIRPR